MLNIQLSIAKDIEEPFRRAPDVMMRHLSKGLRRGALEVSRDEKKEVPKAFSLLTNSITVIRHGRLSYEVVPTTEYAEAVHEGTPPGAFPPLESIQEWIRIKHIVPDQGRTERDLAFMIARGIAKKGIAANRFAQRTFENMEDRVHEIMHLSAQSGMAEARL